MKDAENAFKGGYAECTPEEQTITRETLETCEEFYEIKHKSCFARQLIEIDPQYTYQCSKKREVKDRHCFQQLTLSCGAKGTNNNIFGFVVNVKSVNSKYRKISLIGKDFHIERVDFSNWENYQDNYLTNESVFEIGNFNFKRWQDEVKNWAFTDITHEITLDVNQYNQLTSLQITRTHFDVKLAIRVNGHEVFNDKREHIETGDLVGRTAYPNIEIRHLLKEGSNLIKIEGQSARFAYIGVQLGGSGNACSSWQENWEEICNFL